MATSKHFLEQVKTGDVAAALQIALENAGSLTIVTHIAGAGSADDLPDSQKILTHIDAVAGTIETSVGEKFVQDEGLKALCEGHMQQVVAGCSSVRDNLDTIQALLDWVTEEPGAIASTASEIEAQGEATLGNAAEIDAPSLGESGIEHDLSLSEVDAGSAGLAAAGLGAAGIGAAAMASSPAEDSMLDGLEVSADETFGDAMGFEGADDLNDLGGLGTADSGDGNDGGLLDDLSLESDSAEVELDLGDSLGLEGDNTSGGELELGNDLGFGDDLGLGDDFGLGDDSNTAAGSEDLGFGLDDAAADGEDAGPETEFLMADSGDTNQLFGSEPEAMGAEELATSNLGEDLGVELGDALGQVSLGETAAPLGDASVDDPLAGLELGGDFSGDASSDDPFSLGDDSATEAPLNLEEDTLAGVSWAESGSGDGELDLGGLDLGDDTAPDASPDPEVDDLALDAIGDFDSGMWDEASSETVDLQGEESPAKVSRSLESLFSADEGNAPSAEGEASSNDPLSALFSDTSLDDIPSDSGADSDSQETLAANPFEIDDLENDPFADLMLDEPNS